MSKYFEKAFEATLGLEGGYVNDPSDPGGETKWGISKRSYPDLDIAHLTVEDAKIIYKRDYWDELYLDMLNNESISEEIFDTAVNTGRSTATKIAQKALNYLGDNVTVDGIMGFETVSALQRWIKKDERALFVCLNGFQFMYYYEITEKKSVLKRFARGWTKRVQNYKAEV